MAKSLTRTILSINESELDSDSMWYRKSNYFTLVCELLFNQKEINDFIGQLMKFEESVMANKSSDKSTNDFAQYYAQMYAGTNSRNARVKRSEIMKEYTGITSS